MTSVIGLDESLAFAFRLVERWGYPMLVARMPDGNHIVIDRLQWQTFKLISGTRPRPLYVIRRKR